MQVQFVITKNSLDVEVGRAYQRREHFVNVKLQYYHIIKLFSAMHSKNRYFWHLALRSILQIFVGFLTS